MVAFVVVLATMVDVDLAVMLAVYSRAVALVLVQ